jgi:hypothetical protein
MDRYADKRQTDQPIPKEFRSAHQGRAGNENNPLDHPEEWRLSLL